MASSNASRFQCPDGVRCDLTEDEITSFDKDQYFDILSLAIDHGIDVNEANNTLQVQRLLFEHLRLLKDLRGQRDRREINSVV